MNVEQARFNMIEQQIRPWDVLDLSVLSLLAVVKREDFVPAAHRAVAFMDLEVPLPGGQVMLAPRASRPACCRSWPAAPREGAGSRHWLRLHGRADGAQGADGRHLRSAPSWPRRRARTCAMPRS
ncbi:MAG: hypothetical protein U1F21_11590 [Sphaerotilus natans]